MTRLTHVRSILPPTVVL